jgi:hypothetical protein
MVPLHAMEALGGEEVFLQIFHNVGTTRAEWSASRVGHALSPGKGPPPPPPVPIVQEAGWASEPVWTQRLEEIFSAFVGIRIPVKSSASAYNVWNVFLCFEKLIDK